MKKKILAIAAVMALVCGLAAGCGSSSEPAQDTQQNEVAESATEEITEAEAVEEEADAEEEKETIQAEERTCNKTHIYVVTMCVQYLLYYSG